MANPTMASGADVMHDLHTSPKWVAAALLVFGLVFATIADPASRLSENPNLLYLTVLFYTAGILVWLLDDWRTVSGKWFAIVSLVSLTSLGAIWLGVPGFLVLLVLPPVLAVALIGLRAATLVATSETILLALLWISFFSTEDTLILATILISIWAALGLTFAVYWPMYQLVRWAWQNYHEGTRLLEEARSQKAELEQVTEDLMSSNLQLESMGEKLTVLRMAAEEAQKSKAEFVAKVSHEFRTPLNMIVGLIDVVLETPEIYDGELPAGLLQDLEIVHRNSEHLASMINDVLDLSQAESGRLVLHREWTDLSTDIDMALTVVHPLLEKKGLELDLSIPDDVPKCYLDRKRIRQVILNLASNAARFTDEGGISVNVVHEDNHVIVSVADTGPGIAEEDTERIFEPFTLGSNDSSRKRGGSGLGLSISKQIVELHDGQIWLESKPGLGATFAFRLPAEPHIPPSSKPGRWIDENWVWYERISKPIVPKLPSKKRLVICDETGALGPGLGRRSDDLDLVQTGVLSEAIEELTKWPAQAFVLNTEQAGSLLTKAQDLKATISDTPILVCSFPAQTRRALESGAVNYLTKPITSQQMAGAIEALGISVQRVLIADDNPDVQELLARMLRVHRDKLETSVASNGQEALERLRQFLPDLMLLDIVLPDMDGWQILALKNQDPSIRDIPTIIVSAQDQVDQALRSDALLLSVGQGVSIDQLVRCSLQLSDLLVKPG